MPSVNTAQMSTSGKVIAMGAGVVGVGLLALSKARAIGNLIFLPGPIHSVKFIGANPVITFGIMIQNASAFPMVVDSIAGQLYVDGTLIGNISAFNSIIVPANAQIMTFVDAKLLLIGIVNGVIKAFQFRNSTVNIAVEGVVSVGLLQVPISLQFSINGQ